VSDGGDDRREGWLVFARIRERHENPVAGEFDLAHSRAIHCWQFQVLAVSGPAASPARRDPPDGWTRRRALEGDNRAEYEAWFRLERLRGMMGERTLEAILRERLSRPN